MHRIASTVFCCLLLVILLPANRAHAQGMDDGSIYSRFGLGELQRFPSSQIQALGGGGVAVWSLNYANFGNPASWGYQVLTRASAGFRLQNLTATDASDNTKDITTGSLGAVQFSFPLQVNKLGVGLSFEPYSRVHYSVRSTGELTDPSLDTTSTYRIFFEGSGGLQQLRGGLGYRLNDNVSVGGSVDVLFGIIEEGRRTRFDNFVDFTETRVATSTQLWGVTGTLGALFTVSNLLREEDDFTLGTTFTLPVTLNGERVNTLGESLDRDTLGTRLEGDVQVPFGLSLGAAYQTDNRWLLVVNGRYEPWSEFDSDFAFPGFVPGDFSRLQDRLRLSGGVEFLPAGRDQLAPYFSRVAYRLGAYYDQAYVAPAAGTEVNTFAVTGGISLPTLLPGTRLDINLEAGTRGSTEATLVHDVFYGISATVNFGERWFLERKLR